ncbi:MAG: hypothetical protein EBU46_00695 [Nitrosomonadaceae bacterium]|nr:hypothetical protein [Nitrosomonadaceae bacterium]
MSFLNQVNLLEPPVFEIGQTVYTPTPRGVEKTVIKGLNLRVVSDYTEDPPTLVAAISSYETTRIHPNLSFNWQAEELFTTPKEAETAAIFIEVVLDDADWNELLGMTVDGERVHVASTTNLVTLDSCALPQCCSTISEIRDLFFSCWQQHGLMAYQIDILRDLISHHESPDPHPILDDVLTQLNLTWNQNPE